MSVRKMLNNKGPNKEPCGITDNILKRAKG